LPDEDIKEPLPVGIPGTSASVPVSFNAYPSREKTNKCAVRHSGEPFARFLAAVSFARGPHLPETGIEITAYMRSKP